jgi:hypothetical protein
MTRRLLNLLTLLSLLLCVAAISLWVRSYRKQSAVGFDRGGVHWEVSSDRGTLRLDNEPQRKLEADVTARERARLMAECVRLSHEFASLRTHLSQATAEGQPGIEAEIGRVRALSVANRNERAASFAKPASATPPVAYTAPHSVVAGGAGVLPAIWLAMAARRAGRMRSRRNNDLCTSCGYDLRATPGRCPECGQANGP